MNPKLKAYLTAHCALRADASDAEAQEFYIKMNPADRARADAHVATPETVRSEPQLNPPPTITTPNQQPNPPTERGGNQNEHDRVRQIMELAGDDIPRDILTRALTEGGGWPVERASREFLTAVRGSRRPGGAPQQGQAPAIHSRSREVDISARSLSAGLLISQNFDPTQCRAYDEQGDAYGPKFSEQDAENGQRLARLSAYDFARQCAFVDTQRNILDYGEAYRAAISGGTMNAVFTTNVNARLVAGFTKKPDTTQGWCDEEDVANFLKQEDISLTADSAPEKLARGGTAKHATTNAANEEYMIGRFAKQFVVDEQDFINDRLGAIMKMPNEMGEQMGELRPNLVYSAMILNPNLKDGGAVFNATAVTTVGGHANLLTYKLGFESLKLAISAMGKQREGNRVLNIKPIVIIVPEALSWMADTLVTPATLARLFGNTQTFSTENPIPRRQALQVVVDDRIGAGGVINPNNDNKLLPGSDSHWFLGAGGSRSLRVAYRRGTGRRPMVRNFQLDRGQWGFGWDINFDIGVAFMDFRTFQKSTGAVAEPEAE